MAAVPWRSMHDQVCNLITPLLLQNAVLQRNLRPKTKHKISTQDIREFIYTMKGR
jgi:hypothetical protein